MSWEVQTMLSATSFFNKTLFKKNLQRFWPLWLGYSLIWFFILPLIQLTELLYGYMNAEDLISVSRTILEMSAFGGLVMALIFGLLFAMAEFSYLTNGRATQGLHALSARRETFFFTNYLSGLFCQISTLLATFLLLGFITLLGSTFDASVLVRGFVICSLYTVFFYSFAVFCMMFSGQALAAPVFYGIFNALSITMETLIRTFSGSFLYGYADTLNEMYTDFLCPVWMFVEHVNVKSIREVQPVFVPSTGVTETQHVVVGFELEGFGLIVIYALAGIVLALLALAVYRRRASEETGTTVAIPWARPIFKYGVAVCAALSLGQLVYYMLFGNYISYRRLFLPGMICCMIFAGLLGFFAAEMLLKKRFNVFRSSLGGAVATASVLVLIGVGMSLDLTGYETYIPDADDVERVYVSFYSDGVDFYEDIYSDESIDALLAAHAAIIAEKDRQLAFMENNDYAHINDDALDESYYHFSVRYYLENGREVRRNYNGGRIFRDDLSDPNSFASAITEFINTKESSYARVLGRNLEREHIKDFTITGGNVEAWYGNTTYNELDRELNAEQARAVYDALLLDYELGNASRRSIFYTPANEKHIDLALWYTYTFTVEEGDYAVSEVTIRDEKGNATIHLNLYPEMVNTFSLLKSYGYLPQGF